MYDILNIRSKSISQSVSELINDKAVYRTAPGTLGLLIISFLTFSICKISPHSQEINFNLFELFPPSHDIDVTCNFVISFFVTTYIGMLQS